MLHNPLVVAVRYAVTGDVDAIEELDKVIGKKGEAWFGKFGQRIGPETARLIQSDDTSLAVLIRNLSPADKGKYRFKTYLLKNISPTPPNDARLYPAYYKAHMTKITSWMAVRPY